MKEEKKVRGVFEKVRGSGAWWIRYIDAAGVYHREKGGSKSAAQKLYSLRKGEALQGKLPELRKRAIPFSEIMVDGVDYIKKRYTRPEDDVSRAEVVKEWFGGRNAASLTPDEIERKLDQAQQENGWSASTRNHYQNVLSLAYRLARRAGKVKESPIHGKLRKQTENNSRVRFLSPEEEKKLRAAIRSKPEWAEHEPEVDLAVNTGLRRGSMYVALAWQNVDLGERVAIIPETKNGEQVVVPLNDAALRALAIFRSRGDGTGRVVRNAAGEPVHTNGHWFRPVVRAAGIKDFRWHDLRHTYASRLRQTGTPLGNIAELLGHRGLAMTKRYAHLSISNLHEAVAKIASTNSTTVAPEPISQPLATERIQ